MGYKEYLEREKMYACWLCNFPDIGNGKMHRLSENCGGPEGVYFSDREKWRQVLTEKQVESLVTYTEKWRPREEYEKMRQQGISLLNVWEEKYPKRLKEIPDAPYGLFVKGEIPGEDAPTVAIIGARDCSEYGKFVARELGAVLGRHGVPVISGMARGIDGIAQEAALSVGGISVGVLGSGVDVCYPAQNRDIYERLIKRGAVISSYPLQTPARAMNFPPRNRIVSGLADAVVVIEAREKSGTRITVDMALEQGREVFIVPGRITDRLSDGCNRLIKQGASLLLSPEEFLDELWEIWERRQERVKIRGDEDEESGIGISAKRKSIMKRGESVEIPAGTSDSAREKIIEMKEAALLAGLSPECAAIYKALDGCPKTADEILAALPNKYQNIQITTHLMRLCMENKAIQVTPGHFCRRGG